MHDYYVRALPTDWPTLVELGVKLGALAQFQPEPPPAAEEGAEPAEAEAEAPVETVAAAEPFVTAAPGGAWDFIGEMQKPTGEVIETDSGPAPVMQTVTDENGVAYWHANLRTPIDLGDAARQKAESDPEIADALQQLGRFFLLDEDGKPRAPRQPVRVWF